MAIQLCEEIYITINQRMQVLNALLLASSFDGILETVPAYCTLLVHYDPLILTFDQVAHWVRGQMERVDN